GGRVLLTRERLEHILEHREMVGMEEAIGEALRLPEAVVQSRSDPGVRLHYRRFRRTRVGDKLLCVVVKSDVQQAFVLTAYLADKMKAGTWLWPPSEWRSGSTTRATTWRCSAVRGR